MAERERVEDLGLMAARPHAPGISILVRLCVAALLAWQAASAAPAIAQDANDAAQEQKPEADAPAQSEAADKEKASFFDQFVDDQDGKFDMSKILAKGGFIPVPVIITEPAVDGGFGVVAQFVSMDPENPRQVTRHMVGGVKTGNGSYGYGYFQSGHAMDGRLSYKFGIGRGKITLDAYPRFAPSGVSYTNNYDFGFLASALWHLPDDRFSFGPLVDFRQLHSRVTFPNLPEDIAPDFDRKLNTGALGFGFHFDSRDNPLSPTQGVNAFVEGKFNDGAFGSDRDFQIYDVDVYAFHKLTPAWRLGGKVEVDASRGNYPMFFAPAIDLRGVPANRYQGATVLSTEAEVIRQLSDRWSVLAFGGIGATDSGGSRLFSNSGAIFSGGIGFRYKIARLLGLDAGVDLAFGPEGKVFYLQFGHAWSMGMD